MSLSNIAKSDNYYVHYILEYFNYLNLPYYKKYNTFTKLISYFY